MFYYLYSLLATTTYIVASPILLTLSFKEKYKRSIPARFFLYKNPPLKEDGIHFHICSFGEAKSIEPLIEKLDKNRLRFTTTTETGFSVIKNYSKEARFLPFEIFLPFWLNRKRVLVVTEAELWYMLFRSYKKLGAKTVLINARVSTRSYPKYLRFRWFYRRVFENIDMVFAQSQDDAKRLKELGAMRVEVTGNIKFAKEIRVTKNFPKNFNLVVTAGSTHDGEEELILDAFLELKRIESNSQLIIVPRHPERFNRVVNIAHKRALEANLSFDRYSDNREFKSDIVVIDSLGELINSYAISDIVILGGAFEKIGGHNAIEPAHFGCKVITGKHHFNQVEMFNLIENIEIVDGSELKDRLLNHNDIKPSRVKSNLKLDRILDYINDPF